MKYVHMTLPWAVAGAWGQLCKSFSPGQGWLVVMHLHVPENSLLFKIQSIKKWNRCRGTYFLSPITPENSHSLKYHQTINIYIYKLCVVFWGKNTYTCMSTFQISNFVLYFFKWHNLKIDTFSVTLETFDVNINLIRFSVQGYWVGVKKCDIRSGAPHPKLHK